jgi:hypothetical protein
MPVENLRPSGCWPYWRHGENEDEASEHAEEVRLPRPEVNTERASDQRELFKSSTRESCLSDRTALLTEALTDEPMEIGATGSTTHAESSGSSGSQRVSAAAPGGDNRGNTGVNAPSVNEGTTASTSTDPPVDWKNVGEVIGKLLIGLLLSEGLKNTQEDPNKGEPKDPPESGKSGNATS